MESPNPTRTPAEVFHPGVHLQEELDAREWTIADFAKRIHRPIGVVRLVVEGRLPMTPDLADAIALAFGQHRGIWMELQASFDAAQTKGGDARDGR